MPNLRISELPTGSALTGTELVPVSQNGTTIQTTTAAISGSISLNYPFITVGNQPLLTSSRQIGVGSGLSITDGGAQGTLQISPAGALSSLVAAGNGILTKSGTTITARSIATSGSGLSIADGDGVAANPTLSLAGYVAQVAGLSSGTGLVSRSSGGGATLLTITGTASEIDVASGDGSSGNPIVSIADNPAFPGVEGVILPSGATGDRPVSPANGTLRYNTTTQNFEGYVNGAWGAIAAGSGVTSITSGLGISLSPATITSTGSVGIDTSVVATLTDTQTLTNKTISGSSNTLSNIGNASLTNSSLTYNGVTVSLGGAGTITASNPNALTVGTGLQLDSGTTYDGSSARTISIDSTVATLTGSQTLTNKTISGSSNTLTNIGNASLTNSSLTIGTTAISLGATSLTLAGLTSVTVTGDPTSALQLATKQYVDAVAEGLHVHASCAAATTGTLASITGGSVTYNNGTSGVGATLTLGVALTTLDGYTLLDTNRILVKNETNQAHNGIYTWATGGTVLTRATDFDTPTEIASGDFTFVSNGTLYANTGWVQTQPCDVVGTDPIIWQQFSGSGAYTAGTGLTLTGTQFSITNTGVSAATYGSASQVPVFAVNAQGQITSVTNTAIAISSSAVSGLGTMATQNASSVAITGGTINGTTIGGTTAAAGTFTTVTATTGIYGGAF